MLNEIFFRIKSPVFILFFTLHSVGFSLAQTPLNPSSIDHNLLNKHILLEVNKLRKKVKAPPLYNEVELYEASADHAKYMLGNRKITHFQKDRIKKTPKNRVDYFVPKFDRVGENVQLTNLNLGSTPKHPKHPLLDSYEKLAEMLVVNWKNSPPHYANLIDPDYVTTFTAVAISDLGEVYACQLFGGSKYEDKYLNERTIVELKSYEKRACWRCRIRPPGGEVFVTEDSTIVYRYVAPRFFGIPVPSIAHSRMRFFNPRRDGLAADIVVKSQFSCDTNSYFNGHSNVRGILLNPVYKKEFNRGIKFGYTEIVLGQVPSYIHEEFEVNLVVIQNKRPCSNTLFNVMPSKFDIDIPLSYDFSPLNAKLKTYVTDTISWRMYFDKSSVRPRDSVLSNLVEWVQSNNELIYSVQLTGFASIEGSTEVNTLLYSRRVDFLRNELSNIGMDTTLCTVRTSENFIDFRKDIRDTKYAYLDTLSDAQLKQFLVHRANEDDLEIVLRKHRYVDVRICVRSELQLEYSKDSVNAQLKHSIMRGDVSKSIELQQIQYSLALSGKMDWNEVESVHIPLERRNLKLLHNQTVMKYTLQPVTVESLKAFRTELWSLSELKHDDKRLNTSVAIIDYQLYRLGEYKNLKLTMYDSIQRWKNLDEVQRARMLLNIASRHDWGKWLLTGSMNEKNYWYNKVRRYVAPARLDIEKTFEIASYYQFFQQNKYAYELTKRIIDDTDNPHDLIFFLKLIHFTDVRISRTTYLKYFKRIMAYSGDDFCSFFNSPALNFQILEDEEVKAIYCEACRDD